MPNQFAWDARKARLNLEKHGISFIEAASVFLDPFMLSKYDSENSSTEDRWLSLGVSKASRLLFVVHVERVHAVDETVLRIISARKASLAETLAYEQRSLF
ncbi:MAG: BrnT family toxin [Spirochaetales bacterium]